VKALPNMNAHAATLPPGRLRRWLGGDRLQLSIAVVLMLKAALLYGLYLACFSAPQARHMRMPAADVARHLVPAPPPSPKAEHDTTR
jgi:hypothetical protein